MDPTLVVGLDVAAPRACTAVAVRDGRAVTEADWMETSNAADMIAWIVSVAPAAVGIDAPQSWNRRLLLPDSRSRVCDHELLRRRISLYQVPARTDVESGAAELPAWMEAGFGFFRSLTRASRGFEKAREGALPGAFGQPPAVLEVYPYATFATLLVGLPERKTSRRGVHRRVACLRREGLRWEDYYDHDSLDALAAALTALRFVQGRVCAVGDPREGLIWLPVPPGELRDAYEPLS